MPRMRPKRRPWYISKTPSQRENHPRLRTCRKKVSEDEYRYYRALYLGEVCLQCHGELETMDPGVVTALKERYSR